MAENKDVKFDTIFTGDFEGYNIGEDNMPLKVGLTPKSPCGVVGVFYNVNSEAKTINNTLVDDGELCIVMQGDEYVDFEINEEGELIVHGKNANNYSINEDQELIYTER